MNRRLSKLEARKKALVTSSEAILDAADKEDREVSAEEKTTLDANTVDLATTAAAIDREVSLSGYSTQIEVGGFDVDDPLGHIGNVKSAFEDDPKKGFKSPREFLTSVIGNADRPSAEARDERLKFLATAGSDEQGTYADPYGGFLVPVGFAPELMQMTPEEDPIGGRVTKIPMTTPRVEVLARVDKSHSTSVSGGLTVCRRAETQTQAASRMSMEKIALTAHSLFGLAYATEEVLTDSPVSFAAILEAGFRDQFTSHLIDERLNGTGVGEFEGIMISPALVSITKETGQDADSIVYENLIKMRSRCWRYGTAVWLANHDTLPSLMSLVMPIGTGGVPLWQVNSREGEPDTILGRPVILTEYCETLGDKGDIMLVNFSEYLEGTLESLQSAESIHVRFVNHERTFKFWLRNGGRCWWRSALTPKNSTNTLSPFVTLNERA